MESELLNEQEIYLNAGRVDVSFVIKPRELQRVENPVVFEIAREGLST
jgi:prolyl-tRNA editing enzyme YbaK/EbsC (Cys-tRNA(Pro) deacylase)